MEKAIAVLNELERAGQFTRYAIGGAMAAAFYAEPVLTYDLDIFVYGLPSSGPLLTLSPLYDALRARGYMEEHEHVIIEGLPVQFLPVCSPLVEEAVREATEITYGATQTRVLRAEHLIAIMVETGRPKDIVRLDQMAHQAEFDAEFLMEVLTRHGLIESWRKVQSR